MPNTSTLHKNYRLFSPLLPLRGDTARWCLIRNQRVKISVNSITTYKPNAIGMLSILCHGGSSPSLFSLGFWSWLEMYMPYLLLVAVSSENSAFPVELFQRTVTV